MIRENQKKIEKKARAMLLNKEIPSDKMEIVRSLLHNNSLSSEEKFSAVIDIIKLCPDKGILRPENKLNDINKVEKENPPVNNYFAPEESGDYINILYYKYKLTKLFKKRYLIHVNNRLGIGIKKRLIPGKKLLKAFRDIISFQEKIYTRLPDILMEILKDESIENPMHFNYLRIFRRWMMDTPLIKYNMYEIKWMHPSHIEAELQSYLTNFFGFFKLDIETKEQLLLIIENKLRLMDDLKKEEPNPSDPSGVKKNKEKANLKKEKIIYDYLITVRAFLQPGINRNDILSEYLKANYGINSFSDFMLIIFEALVFRKEIELNNILSYYKIQPHSVSSENWDYSIDFLKEIGKDPASRKKRQLQKLENELIPYNELYSYLKLRIDGQLVLENAVESQWKYADKKLKDFTYLYNEDFLTFIDVCINYFNNTYVPLLNGSPVTFQDNEKVFMDGSIFSSAFFANELGSLSELVSELHIFKTSNPRMVVSHEEAIKIMQGKIRSMFEIERFINLAGDLFNQIAEKLHALYDSHRIWILNGKKPDDYQQIFTPVRNIPENEKGAPLPYYNCSIIDFKDNRLLTDKLKGKYILTESTRSGLLINVTALAYQLAYECLNDNIQTRLERRKDILKEIKNLNI
ncbi:MAG: hypothetical protein JW864_04235 [Spirochaetes bacterium]|nr:hypothetical protein [Spirochaetota bacterium]